MFVLALIACVATHHGADGTTYSGMTDATDARILTDGDVAAAVVEKGSRDIPVTLTTTVNDGRRSTTVSATVGGPYVASYGGMDPRLAQAAAYSAVYRQQWSYANGGVPTIPVAGAKTPAPPHATAGTAPAAGIDPSATCPTDRAPATQGELDACQSGDISHILDTVGTVKGGAK